MSEQPIDIMRHLPTGRDKYISLGIKKVDKHQRLRELRLNTYMGQLNSLPPDVSDAGIRARIRKAKRAPIEVYAGP